MYTYVHSSLLDPPCQPPIPPLKVNTEQWAELSVLYGICPLAILCIVVYICQCYLSMCLTLFSPLTTPSDRTICFNSQNIIFFFFFWLVWKHWTKLSETEVPGPSESGAVSSQWPVLPSPGAHSI